MTAVVLITASNPLSTGFVHLTPTEVGSRSFYSVQSLISGCLLAQHGMQDRIDEIVFDERFRVEAFRAAAAARTALDRAGIPISAPWTLNQYATMFYALANFASNDDPGNSFRSYFDHLYDLHGLNVGFMTPNARNDYIWSTGLRPSQIGSISVDTMLTAPGYNLYGRLVGVVYFLLYSGQLRDFDLGTVDRLLSGPVYDRDASYTKTVAMVSDSIFRHAARVDGGDVFAMGGATATTIANRLWQNRIDLPDYKVLVLCVGTNDSNRPRSQWATLWAPLSRMLQRACELSPELKIVFNTGIGYPYWEKVPDHARALLEWVRADLPASQLYVFDWSVPSASNHLLTDEGHVVPEFADYDQRHPNFAGLRRMAVSWAHRVAELSCVGFSFFDELYPVGQLQ